MSPFIKMSSSRGGKNVLMPENVFIITDKLDIIYINGMKIIKQDAYFSLEMSSKCILMQKLF